MNYKPFWILVGALRKIWNKKVIACRPADRRKTTLSLSKGDAACLPSLRSRVTVGTFVIARSDPEPAEGERRGNLTLIYIIIILINVRLLR